METMRSVSTTAWFRGFTEGPQTRSWPGAASGSAVTLALATAGILPENRPSTQGRSMMARQNKAPGPGSWRPGFRHALSTSNQETHDA
jgi:hypothetical protein